MNKLIDIILRELRIEDLEDYLYWNHPSREFHKLNGPYFVKDNEEELRKYVADLKERFINGEKNIFPNRKIIANKVTNEIIGQVNWYWKSQETLWMEIGIAIFNEDYWGCGIGYNALRIWIDEIFVQNPELVRIGLTTWSGNERMMNLSEKLGLKKEAVYRKARIVESKYYDSVSYGMLREEWES